MIFDFLNMCSECPEKGDVLVIETTRNKGVKILVSVKDVVVTTECAEVILQKGKNKFFNYSMYEDGNSWVWKIWNLGNIKLTSGLNNQNSMDEM